MNANRPKRVRALSIAGVDPSGGAGILADIKSFTAFGAYGMAAVASLTAQNTCGVSGIHVPPSSFLKQQLDAISSDITVDSVKIGLLGDASNIQVVTDWVKVQRELHALKFVVLDPVMVATSGDRLLNADSEIALLELAKSADIITPNIPELAVLLNGVRELKREASEVEAVSEATSWEAALDQARELAWELRTAVFLKGGHLAGPDAGRDALVEITLDRQFVVQQFEASWVQSSNTHGTGCSFSSALAAIRPGVASWGDACGIAKEWLTRAIEDGSQLDVGGLSDSEHSHGPVDHLWNLTSL
jgi:hydroxymethylpyrimidine kinase/phosphomethylpyrimidine kinase